MFFKIRFSWPKGGETRPVANGPFFYMAKVKKKVKRCDNCTNWRRSFGSFGKCPYMEFEQYISNSCDKWIGRKVERKK